MNKRVLLIGNSAMDLTANMFKIPSPGNTVVDDGGVAYTPGGSGLNAAVAFKRLGGCCKFLTKLGADVHGERLFRYFKELGVDTSLVKVDGDAPTGFSLVIRERDCENRVVYYPGANERLSLDNVSSAFSENPDAIFVGLDTEFDTVLFACKMASARSIPIFVDATYAQKDVKLSELPDLEIFSLDDSAALELTGIRPLGADNALRVFLTLQHKINAKYIVLRVGERGVFVYDGKHHSVAPAFPVSKIVDTSGSADTFNSALVIMYLETNDVRLSARFASAASALAMTSPGAAVSIPEREEVQNFMSKYETL